MIVVLDYHIMIGRYSTLSNNRAGWNKLCRMENFQNLIKRAGWNKLCRMENFLTLIKCAGLNKLCRIDDLKEA